MNSGIPIATHPRPPKQQLFPSRGLNKSSKSYARHEGLKKRVGQHSGMPFAFPPPPPLFPP
jgi:hypothetical protein